MKTNLNELDDWQKVVAALEEGVSLKEAQRDMQRAVSVKTRPRKQFVSIGQRKAVTNGK